MDRMARRDEMTGHGLAHDAETDETQICHGVLLLSACFQYTSIL
jgi:hypothetical protein